MGDDTPAPLPTPTLAPRSQWFSISTPIGLIGGFTAIVEVALILTTIFIADTNFRWGLFVFAVVAFFYVSSWFFYLLRNRNWVLYQPRDYGGETTALDYVGAMSATQLLRREVSARTETHQITVEQTAAIDVPALTDENPITLVVTDESRSLPELEGSSQLALNLGEMSTRIAYDPTQWVGKFIIAASEAMVPLRYFSTPEGYGLTWILQDIDTGQRITDMGFVRIRPGAGRLSRDFRRVQEVGIRSGMRLTPVNLPPPEVPSPYVVNPPPADVGSIDEFLRQQGWSTDIQPRVPATRPPATRPPSS
jgi:hypothetical protein